MAVKTLASLKVSLPNNRAEADEKQWQSTFTINEVSLRHAVQNAATYFPKKQQMSYHYAAWDKPQQPTFPKSSQFHTIVMWYKQQQPTSLKAADLYNSHMVQTTTTYLP